VLYISTKTDRDVPRSVDVQFAEMLREKGDFDLWVYQVMLMQYMKAASGERLRPSLVFEPMERFWILVANLAVSVPSYKG